LSLEITVIKNKKHVINQLNKILEADLAGVVRYTH
jgi:bacterioferritin (cytochrome b1)